MWCHAALATAVMTLAVTPVCAAKITVSQYGRLVATLPWAVALQKNMFKAAGLDIDGITAGAGGGTSLHNMLAGELPYAELATSAAIAGSLAGVELKALASSSNHIGELSWAAKPDAGINSINDLVGKKVAYTSPRSITEMVIRTALKQEGLAGKVDILPLGGLGPALTALAQGAVAAAPLNDPALTVTPDKYKVLFYAHQYYPKFTWQVAVTTKEFAAKKFADPAQDPQGPSPGGRVRLQQPRGGGAHLCQGVGGIACGGQCHPAEILRVAALEPRRLLQGRTDRRRRRPHVRRRA